MQLTICLLAALALLPPFAAEAIGTPPPAASAQALGLSAPTPAGVLLARRGRGGAKGHAGHLFHFSGKRR